MDSVTTAHQRDTLALILASNAKYVIGVDEVGLGAIAGPLYVTAAVFEKGWGDPDVRDSKKYSSDRARRKVLVTKVLPRAVHYLTRIATSADIDSQGIGAVLHRLTLEAINGCRTLAPDSIVVMDGDGGPLTAADNKILAMPKADSLVPAVSAASIIAKTARDELMETFDAQYPWYGFRTNRGYPTPAHIQALEKMGVCPLHRRSYDPVRRVMQRRGA